MSTPNAIPGQERLPARPVVSPEAVARLPRWPLWLLCVAYVLPGFIGRDPWKGDGLAFGVMWQIAQGHSHWLTPTLYGQAVGGGWLPYWMGAISVRAFGSWIGAIDASRVPFVAMLGFTLIQTWYAAYHFTLRDTAQPVQPAFAAPISARNYARAMADGALLSLVACLGLLGRGHETIPELVQLGGFTSVLLGLSLLPANAQRASATLLGGLLILAGSGAPWLALFAALTAAILAVRHTAVSKPLIPGLALAAGITAAIAVLLMLHGESAAQWPNWGALQHFFGTVAWFMWPAWPLAAWAVWRWRESLGEWHVLAPFTLLVLTTFSAMLAAGNAATLVLALPPAAVLAALALPVMRRGSLAALDWFSLMFFSLMALVVWVLWLAMLTGFPSKPAANIARLAPGFVAHFSWWPTILSVIATLGWATVVFWRAGRHRHPLWKGMVLSAGGVTLVWVLVALLWLPVMNYVSTYRPLALRLAAVLREQQGSQQTAPCVQTLGLNQPQQALVGYFSGAALIPGLRGGRCPLALVLRPAHAVAPHDIQHVPEHMDSEIRAMRQAERGLLLWNGHRPGETDENMRLYSKSAAK